MEFDCGSEGVCALMMAGGWSNVVLPTRQQVASSEGRQTDR